MDASKEADGTAPALAWSSGVPTGALHMEPDEDGTLLVTCPDIPEVTTFGADEADARRRAADAIAIALLDYLRLKQPLPAATDGEGDWIDVGLEWVRRKCQ